MKDNCLKWGEVPSSTPSMSTREAPFKSRLEILEEVL